MTIFRVEMDLRGSYIIEASSKEEAKEVALQMFDKGEDPEIDDFRDFSSVWEIKKK